MGVWGKIKKAAKKVRKKAKEVVDDVVDKGKETLSEIDEAKDDMVDDVKDTWREATDRAKRSWDARGLFGAVGAILGGVVSIVGDIAGGVVSITGAAVGGAVSTLGAAVGGLFIVAGTGIAEVGAIVGEIAGSVLSAVGAQTAANLSRQLAADLLGAWGNLFIGIGAAIRDGTEGLGESIADVAARLGRVLAWVGHAAGDLLWQLGMAIDCAVHIIRGKKKRPSGNLGKVDHFIVLMLENRSFDHMLGDHLGVTGLDVRDPIDDEGDNNGLAYTRDAPDKMKRDPPHEFLSTRYQLWGSLEPPTDPPKMKWFAQAYVDHEDFAADGDKGAPVMKGFSAKTAPIIHRLAREYAVCDHWFSSIPGPTFPNRFFLYSASSSGLASSQRTEYLAAEHVHLGVRFEHGSFFDRLRVRCIPWRVYHGDLFPTVLSVSGMVREFTDFTDNFRHLDLLELDLESADEEFPAFTLIEPSYGRFWDNYEGGTSQHPIDSVQAGEQLIRDVYNAVRASPIWERTMLIVLYDEHGGFYDSQPPPRAVPPGDTPFHQDANREELAREFAYDWYGVRVPAIVISPLVRPSTVDSIERDHTSILKTIEERFNLDPLTQRDAHATSLADLVSLESARADAMNDL